MENFDFNQGLPHQYHYDNCKIIAQVNSASLNFVFMYMYLQIELLTTECSP